MKKQISALMMILAMIAAPSMAQSVDKQAFEAQVFDVQADKPLQLAELSKQEMKETEGGGNLVCTCNCSRCTICIDWIYEAWIKPSYFSWWRRCFQ